MKDKSKIFLCVVSCLLGFSIVLFFFDYVKLTLSVGGSSESTTMSGFDAMFGFSETYEGTKTKVCNFSFVALSPLILSIVALVLVFLRYYKPKFNTTIFKAITAVVLLATVILIFVMPSVVNFTDEYQKVLDLIEVFGNSYNLTLAPCGVLSAIGFIGATGVTVADIFISK